MVMRPISLLQRQLSRKPTQLFSASASQRGFFDQLDHKLEGFNELSLMGMVEPTTMTFKCQSALEFD